MSEELNENPAPPSAPPAPPPSAPPTAVASAMELRVVVRPLPKVVFFYMTWLASLGCALLGSILPPAVLGLAWLGVFVFNLIVISFDFTEERILLFLVSGVATGFAVYHFEYWATVHQWLVSLNPVMNGAFYWVVFGVFSALYVCVWFNTRFNYWEFRPQEVVHRYGLFSKAKRYRAELMRWDKLVPDVLERMLLGTGTIILTTSQEPHPMVLEHVPRIGRVDDRIGQVLGVQLTATQVIPRK